MQVSYSIRTEIQKASDIQANKGRCWPDSGDIVQEKRNLDYRSRSLSGSHPHACKDTAKIFCIRDHGVPERKKFAHDI